MPPASHKRRCSYCLQIVEKVQYCGNCRMVQYCSRDCQKAAWKTHRQCCNNDLKELARRDPNIASVTSILSQWISYWQPTIYLWANWMLDIPNHPKDRLQTHVFFLKLVKRPGKRPYQKSYTLNGGGVLTRQEVIDFLRGLNTGNDPAEDWENVRRGEDTVQIAIFDQEQIRFLWFSYRDMEPMRAPLPDGVPDIMSALQEDWVRVLGDIFESGDLSLPGDHFVNTLFDTIDEIDGDDAEARKAIMKRCYEEPSTLSRFAIA